MNQQEILVTLIVALGSFLGGSGFWQWVVVREKNQTAQNQMLLGLAHQKIVELGMYYIKRGWLTADEFEDLDVYLVRPYRNLKGNGTAERIMNDIMRLPIKDGLYVSKEGMRNENKT